MTNYEWLVKHDYMPTFIHLLMQGAIPEIQERYGVPNEYRDYIADWLELEHKMENRQHGKWTRPRPKSYIRICSVCGKESYMVGNGDYPNCPFCLSIMDGKVEKPKRPRKIKDVCKTRCIYKNGCTREGAEKKYCLVRYLILESLDKVGN